MEVSNSVLDVILYIEFESTKYNHPEIELWQSFVIRKPENEQNDLYSR